MSSTNTVVLSNRASWRKAIFGVIFTGMLLRVLLAMSPYPAAESLQRMTVTRNLVADGLPGFLAPRVDIDGRNPNYVVLECPIYNLLVASLVWLSGLDVLVAGKLVSLGLSFGLLVSCAKLFQIWLRHERMCFWAMVVISFSPTVAYLGQSQSIDLLTTLLAVLCFLLTDKLTRERESGPKLRWYFLGFILYGLLLLSKVNVGVGALSVCGIFALVQLRANPRRLVGVSIAMAGAVGIYLLWQIHADTVKSPDARYALTLSSVFSWPRLRTFMENGMFFRNPIVLMTPVGLLLALLGCRILVRERTRFPYLFVWFVMTGLNFVMFITYFGHFYYWIILAPGCAALAGLGFDWLLQSTAWSGLRPGFRRLFLGAALAVTLLSVGTLLTYLMLPRFQHWVRGMQDLKSLSRPDDLVIFAGKLIDHGGIGVPYYSERRGWILSDFEVDKPAFIQKRARQGANWLIVLDATPDEARAYLGLGHDSKWKLLAHSTLRARMSTQGLRLKDRSYSIFRRQE